MGCATQLQAMGSRAGAFSKDEATCDQAWRVVPNQADELETKPAGATIVRLGIYSIAQIRSGIGSGLRAVGLLTPPNESIDL